ncbi:MAG: 1-(5-phosphoribosyl)-5-[(5-phosphoribosylamino)methylideneamino] imidazole-4-carboxamide isomerase [Candidatus Solibacter usitatus]|nr:1-(5-phosphoribosyl)-5-[(5-phosphoribosylamino)methylideneamino] imidazole-4-carboxamide isomerase [Candidatus Solibacter usitatus]
MIIPCIDLMAGKVVQLVQGRDKALEAESLNAMLDQFSPFAEIQVIDLDAALGNGSNDALVEQASARSKARVGGGVRSADRARTLVAQGAHRVIVGTAAFSESGVRHDLLADIVKAIGRERLIVALDSKDGKIMVKGWRESTQLAAEDVLSELAPYCSGFLCTYVDKEGMMQGTDLAWFARLRAATDLEITAAGGITTLDDVRALLAMNVHAAIGMAVYTGRLNLAELARLNSSRK